MALPAINNLILKSVKKEKYQKYLELMPNFKQEKAQKFITIILTVIASIILGLFAVSPTLSTIAKLQKQLEDARFVEERLSQKINNLSVLQQQYNKIQDDLPLVFEAMPKTSEIPLLTAQIQALASANGLKLSGFQTFQAEVSDNQLINKKFSTYEFSITAQGDYQNLSTFLDKLVNFQRIIGIQSVSITKAQGINNTGLQINIKGIGYFKK